MTKQQVIAILEAYKPSGNVYNGYDSIEEKVDERICCLIDEIIGRVKQEQDNDWINIIVNNADDLISRQAALKAFVDKGQHSRRYKLDEIWELNLCEIEDVLNNLPSVQPEQKTATFYVDGEGYERCSACNEHETGMRYFNFCPNCGAKNRRR